jgi:hypothetical protein
MPSSSRSAVTKVAGAGNVYDAVAPVQATGRFTRADGSTGTSRYTDVYTTRDDSWKVVSAQIAGAPGD